MKERRTQSINKLLFKSGTAVRVVNMITLYRIVTFPLLIFFIIMQNMDVFKWLLLASLTTDAIDGYLARKYNATSVLGAKLDSIGDDLTVLAGVVGMFVVQFDFIKEELTLIMIPLVLFLVQFSTSLIRYKKITSFHTYLAKIAAVVTGIFLLSVFFLEEIIYPLFYASLIVTSIELVEETIIVFLLPRWKANVKGIYWALKMSKSSAA